jgi:hypothetical protein
VVSAGFHACADVISGTVPLMTPVVPMWMPAASNPSVTCWMLRMRAFAEGQCMLGRRGAVDSTFLAARQEIDGVAWCTWTGYAVVTAGADPIGYVPWASAIGCTSGFAVARTCKGS